MRWYFARLSSQRVRRGCLLLAQVGPRAVLGWLAHYWALAAYTLLDAVARPLRKAKPLQGHRVQRWMDAWHWGAGQNSSHAAAAA